MTPYVILARFVPAGWVFAPASELLDVSTAGLGGHIELPPISASPKLGIGRKCGASPPDTEQDSELKSRCGGYCHNRFMLFVENVALGKGSVVGVVFWNPEPFARLTGNSIRKNASGDWLQRSR